MTPIDTAENEYSYAVAILNYSNNTIVSLNCILKFFIIKYTLELHH